VYKGLIIQPFMILNMTKNSVTQFDWDIVPSPDVIKALWKEAIFVFDTNVLLDIYRSQPETRNLLLETLKGLENKSWLPHRVAYEFRRNRRSVIAEANFNLSELQKILMQISKISLAI